MTRQSRPLSARPRISRSRWLEMEVLESRVVPSTSTVYLPLASTAAHHCDEEPDLNEMVDFTDPTGGGSSSGGPTYSSTAVPQLSSLPGAKASLYLNFTGDFTAKWGSFSNITTPAYDTDGDPTTFSQTELDNITKIWRYVSEDYGPFNINVTTIPPTNMGHGFTQKVDIGGNGAWLGATAGGVSYIGSFVSTSVPNISFVFPDNLGKGFPKYVADASSHEAGHAFGLLHQSQYDSNGNKLAEYYAGPGDGTAPLMGNSYHSDLSRWWLGTNSNSASQIQDDLAIIANSTNGFGYRDDSTGNTMATARSLSVNNGQVSGSGIIIKTSDTNYWSFTTGDGQITININVASGVNNLVAKLVLVDASGKVLATGDNNSTTAYSATITTTLAAGTYYVIAESHGGYGDLGQYTLSGTINSTAVTTPAAPTGVTATGGDSQVALTWNASVGAASYNIFRGTTAGGEGATAYKTGVTTTSFTDTGLTNGTKYYYQVTAVNSAGESGKSSEVSATPQKASTNLAIDAGGGAAGSFIADTDFSGGKKFSTNHSIDTSGVTNPAPQTVYQTERYGNFTYTVPNLTPGASYTVRLHFAENYQNAAGKRLFDVSINGSQVLTSFDIYATAGGKYKAIVKEFTATADASGNITIKFTSVKGNAKLSGLEILSASGAPAAGSSSASGAARLAKDLGRIAQFFGGNASYTGWTAWATNASTSGNVLRGLLAQGTSNTPVQRTVEQWLGDHYLGNTGHASTAKADWTDDLLVQWSL